MSAVEIFVHPDDVTKKIKELTNLGLLFISQRSTKRGTYLQFSIPHGIGFGA
jgi:hypothetical protein